MRAAPARWSSLDPPFFTILDNITNLPHLGDIHLTLDNGGESGCTDANGNRLSGRSTVAITNIGQQGLLPVSANFRLDADQLSLNDEQILDGVISGTFAVDFNATGLLEIGLTVDIDMMVRSFHLVSQVSGTLSGLTLLGTFEVLTIEVSSLVVNFTPDDTVSGMGQVQVSHEADATTRTSLDLDMSFGALRLELLTSLNELGQKVVNSEARGRIDPYELDVTDVTFDWEACATLPIAGRFDFFKDDKQDTAEFTDACDGSFLFNGEPIAPSTP